MVGIPSSPCLAVENQGREEIAGDSLEAIDAAAWTAVRPGCRALAWWLSSAPATDGTNETIRVEQDLTDNMDAVNQAPTLLKPGDVIRIGRRGVDGAGAGRDGRAGARRPALHHRPGRRARA
jgi:hypothetical protein